MGAPIHDPQRVPNPPLNLGLEAERQRLENLGIEAERRPDRPRAANGTPADWIINTLLNGDRDGRNRIASVTPEIVTDNGNTRFEVFDQVDADNKTTGKKCLKMEVKWTVTFGDGSPPVTKNLPFYTPTIVPDIENRKEVAEAFLHATKTLHAYIHLHHAAVDLKYAQSNNARSLYEQAKSIAENGKVHTPPDNLYSKSKPGASFSAYYGKGTEFEIPAIRQIGRSLIQHAGKLYVGDLPSSADSKNALGVIDERRALLVQQAPLTPNHAKVQEALRSDPTTVTVAYLNEQGIDPKAYVKCLTNELELEQKAFNELEEEAMTTDTFWLRTLQRWGYKILPSSLYPNSVEENNTTSNTPVLRTFQRWFQKILPSLLPTLKVPRPHAFEKKKAAMEARLSRIENHIRALPDDANATESQNEIKKNLQIRHKEVEAQLSNLKKDYQKEIERFSAYPKIMGHLQQSIKRHTEQLLSLVMDPALTTERDAVVARHKGLQNSLKSNLEVMKDLEKLLETVKIEQNDDLDSVRTIVQNLASSITRVLAEAQQTKATIDIASLTQSRNLIAPRNEASLSAYREVKAAHDVKANKFRTQIAELLQLQKQYSEASKLQATLGEAAPGNVAAILQTQLPTLQQFNSELNAQDYADVIREKPHLARPGERPGQPPIDNDRPPPQPPRPQPNRRPPIPDRPIPPVPGNAAPVPPPQLPPQSEKTVINALAQLAPIFTSLKVNYGNALRARQALDIKRYELQNHKLTKEEYQRHRTEYEKTLVELREPYQKLDNAKEQLEKSINALGESNPTLKQRALHELGQAKQLGKDIDLLRLNPKTENRIDKMSP